MVAVDLVQSIPIAFKAYWIVAPRVAENRFGRGLLLKTIHAQRIVPPLVYICQRYDVSGARLEEHFYADIEPVDAQRCAEQYAVVLPDRKSQALLNWCASRLAVRVTVLSETFDPRPSNRIYFTLPPT